MGGSLNSIAEDMQPRRNFNNHMNVKYKLPYHYLSFQNVITIIHEVLPSLLFIRIIRIHSVALDAHQTPNERHDLKERKTMSKNKQQKTACNVQVEAGRQQCLQEPRR